MLPQLAWDDLRFLIYGTRPGKSQLRLSVVLYSFDGQNLKSLWESHDIYDGKMDIVNDKVTIRHLNEDEYVRDVEAKRKPSRYRPRTSLPPREFSCWTTTKFLSEWVKPTVSPIILKRSQRSLPRTFHRRAAKLGLECGDLSPLFHALTGQRVRAHRHQLR